MYSDGARKERRIPTDSPALVFKADDPFWKADARIANVSANGLLLRMNCTRDVAVGSKIDVRFGTAAVAGHIMHISTQPTHVLVGIAIDDVQEL